jgi:hypothetical protein
MSKSFWFIPVGALIISTGLPFLAIFRNPIISEAVRFGKPFQNSGFKKGTGRAEFEIVST